MTLFAVHGYLRDPFVKLSNTILISPLGHIIAAILFLTTSVIISLAANHVYDFFVSLFDKIKLPEKQNKISLAISYTLQVVLIILTSYILIYFVNQNNFENVKKYIDYESDKNISICQNREFSDITKIHIDKRCKKLKIEGSLDIKKEEDIINLKNIVLEKYNHIDILINNAGVSANKKIDDTTTEDFNNIMNLNVNAMFNMIKAVIFDMFETLITHFKSPLYFGKQIAEDMGIPEAKLREIWDPTDYDRTIGKMTLEEVFEKMTHL